MRFILTGVLAALCAAAAGAETGLAKIVSMDEGLKITGTVIFTDTKDGLKVTAHLSGVPQGPHGFHIHEFGSCEGKGKAAGHHYNPAGAPHGLAAEDGFKHAHAGDLGNIMASGGGDAWYEAVLPGLKVSGGFLSVAGRAMVLDRGIDKFDQPEGSAGSPIGCGVIVVTDESGSHG